MLNRKLLGEFNANKRKPERFPAWILLDLLDLQLSQSDFKSYLTNTNILLSIFDAS